MQVCKYPGAMSGNNKSEEEATWHLGVGLGAVATKASLVLLLTWPQGQKEKQKEEKAVKSQGPNWILRVRSETPSGVQAAMA